MFTDGPPIPLDYVAPGDAKITVEFKGGVLTPYGYGYRHRALPSGSWSGITRKPATPRHYSDPYPDESITISGLTNDTEYEIRIDVMKDTTGVAVEEGRKLVVKATPTRNIQNLTLTPSLQGKIYAEWDIHEQAVSGNRGYVVRWKESSATSYNSRHRAIVRDGAIDAKQATYSARRGYTIWHLHPGKEYTVSVDAYHKTRTGNLQGREDTATAVTLGYTTGKPITGGKVQVGDGKAKVVIPAAPNAPYGYRTHYRRYTGSDAGAWTLGTCSRDGATSPDAIEGLTNGVEYEIRIGVGTTYIPTDADGEWECAGYADTVWGRSTIYRGAPSASVTGLTLTPSFGGTASISASWDPHLDADGKAYGFSFREKGTTAWSSPPTRVAHTTTTHTRSADLYRGREYEVRVDILTASTGTTPQAGKQAVGETCVPGPINYVVATAYDGVVGLNWDSGCTPYAWGFTAYRSTTVDAEKASSVFWRTHSRSSGVNHLENGTEYTFEVYHMTSPDYRQNGITGRSGTPSNTYDPDGTGAKNTVKATPMSPIPGLTISGVTPTQLTLSWSAYNPDNDTSTDDAPHGYGVSIKDFYAADFGAARRVGNDDDGNAKTSYTFTGLTTGTKYTLRVELMASASGSETVRGVTGTVNATPQGGITGLRTANSSNTLRLEWDAHSQARHGYGVSHKQTSAGDFGNVTRVTGTAHLIAGLTHETQYTIRVGVCANASCSATVSGTTATTDATSTSSVTGLRVTEGDRQLTLSWNPHAWAAGYGVSYKLSSADDFGAITRTGGSYFDTGHTITGLENGSQYTVQVYVMSAETGTDTFGLVNPTATGTPSATVSGQSGGGDNGGEEGGNNNPPEEENNDNSAPTLTLTAGEETITASWTAVDDAPHGYAIRWRTTGGTYNAAERRTTTFKSIIRLTAGQEYEVRVDVLANDAAPYQFVSGRHVTAKATPTEAEENGVGIGSVDPPAPSVQSVSVTSNAGSDQTYERGDTITLKVAFDQAVAVTGTPSVKIKMDPSYGVKTASYASGSGTSSLTFSYTVAAPNHSPSGIAIVANSLSGGTIKSGDQDATRTFMGLAHDANHKIDWRLPAPRITGISITSDPGDDDTYGLGDTLRFAVTFDEKVYVTGDPELRIMMDPNWGRDWRADYASGSGTTKLVFEHTVVEPNCSPTGIAVSENPVIMDSNDRIEIHQQHRGNFAFTHAGLGHNAGHKLAWSASCGE